MGPGQRELRSAPASRGLNQCASNAGGHTLHYLFVGMVVRQAHRVHLRKQFLVHVTCHAGFQHFQGQCQGADFLIQIGIAKFQLAQIRPPLIHLQAVTSWMQRLGDSMKLSAKYGNVAVARYSGLWAREGNVYLNAQGGEEHLGDGSEKNSWLELQDVRLYEVGEDGRLQAIVHAGTAEHHRGTGWVLKNGNRIELGEKSATRTRFVEQAWDSKLDAVALAGGISKPRTLSTHALGTTIDYRVRNGLDARDYQDLYWSRWFYPLGVLALCLAVVPFAFGTLRSGGMGKRLFFGILFSLGFLLLQTFASRMADAMRFDFRIAYALPPLLVLAVSMWMFRGREE